MVDDYLTTRLLGAVAQTFPARHPFHASNVAARTDDLARALHSHLSTHGYHAHTPDPADVRDLAERLAIVLAAQPQGGAASHMAGFTG